MKKAFIGILTAIWLINAGMVQAAEPQKRITINVASRILTLYKNGKKAFMYHICAGKIETPTPLGTFTVDEMEENPVWVDPKDVKKRAEPGDGNPLGLRWIGFYDMYGIHGTNNPASIGGYYSNGCIRLKEEDIEHLYPQVEIGTKVEIFYNRLVIERIDDGTIVYYIYPDGYGCQPLDVASVRKALDVYGVGYFLENDEIAQKIEDEDGAPTFLPRAFRIEVDNNWLSGRAVIPADGELYIPVQALSAVTKTDYTRDMAANTVSTHRGTAPAVLFGNRLFVKFDDAKTLFGLTGGFDAESTLKLYTNPLMAEGPQSVSSASGVPAETAEKLAEKDKGKKTDAGTEGSREKETRAAELKSADDKAKDKKADTSKSADVKLTDAKAAESVNAPGSKTNESEVRGKSK
ncbi:MAG: L,D-transpeptidase [Schwartzia sp.]|nr:L,D-transpeptidase [Schwartzia sp. (in: firmicutes)]